MPQFPCPQCQKTLKTPDETAGKRCRCPDCGHVMVIPDASPQSGSPPAAQSPPPSNWGSQPGKPAAPPPSNYPSQHPGSQYPSHYPAGQSAPPPVNPYSPPPQSQSPYQNPSNYGQGPSPVTHSGGNSTALILGIISIVTGVASCSCCGLLIPVGLALGITAWIMGRNELMAIKAGRMHPAGESTANGGMICGIIGTVMCGLSVVIQLAMIILQVVVSL